MRQETEIELHENLHYPNLDCPSLPIVLHLSFEFLHSLIRRLQLDLFLKTVIEKNISACRMIGFVSSSTPVPG